jgi:hypothetical protein
MPFEASFDDVYMLGIKPAAEDAGAYCERIDEQIFAESILARLYNQIAKADLIVADMTGRNPNVFYEVGYAHALGKTVILLTKNADDIPFDLKHYPHIIYHGSIAGLKENLQKRIAHYLANPSKRIDREIVLPEFSISGNPIKADTCIEESVGFVPGQYVLPVGITNPHDTPVDWSDLGAALLLPSDFSPSNSSYGAVQIADKRFLYDLGPVYQLLPGAWQIREVRFNLENSGFETGRRVIEAELRIFTTTGPISTRFSLKFVAGRQAE